MSKLNVTWVYSRTIKPIWRHWSPFSKPSVRHQFTLRDHRYEANASRRVPVWYIVVGIQRAHPRRLSWHGWLVTCRDGFCTVRALTGPVVD